MLRRLLPLLAVVAVLPTAAPAAERTIAHVETPTRERPIGTTTSFPVLDAYGGRVVWSDYDAAANVWRLTEYSRGQERPVPVPPRATPFDVDLGPDGRGGTMAVYSRCERRLPADAPAPLQTSGRRFGCDLYSFSFATGRERRIVGASSSGDEAWPAVWGSRIAFVRTYPGRAGRRGRTPYLYSQRLDGAGSSRRLRRPSSAVMIDDRRFFDLFIIEGLDMRARTAAYTWTRFVEGTNQSFVYTATTGGALRAAARGASTGGGADVTFRSLAEPALAAERVHWLFESEGEPEYVAAFMRRALSGVGRSQASTSRTKAAAFAQTGASSYWIDAGPGATDAPWRQPGGSFALKVDDAIAWGGVPRGWLPVDPPR